MAQRSMPVTMNEMLLRGCTLKNTGHVLGLVVYTGEETRIQMNSAETPLKYGAPPRKSRCSNVVLKLSVLLPFIAHEGLYINVHGSGNAHETFSLCASDADAQRISQRGRR